MAGGGRAYLYELAWEVPGRAACLARVTASTCRCCSERSVTALARCCSAREPSAEAHAAAAQLRADVDDVRRDRRPGLARV